MKIKLLTLALLGLAGNAMALCPTAITTAEGGAWSAKSTTGGTTLGVVEAHAANGTCSLQAALKSTAEGGSSIQKALVTDTTPNDEMRYRVRFYIDTSELTGLTSLLKQVKLFNASALTSPSADLSGEEITISLNGNGGAPNLVFTIADASQGSGFSQKNVPLPVPAGLNVVEFDWNPSSTTDAFRCWVKDPNVTYTENDVTSACSITTLDNTGWSGVTQANMGMFVSNNSWRSSYSNSMHLYFDAFDSRRQTFIGTVN